MNRASDTDQVTIDKLLEDLQTVAEDAEALLKATANLAGDKVREARTRAEESLSAARERLAEVQNSTLHQAREWAGDGEKYIRQNPWQAVGIAAGAGLLAGLLISLSRR